MFLLEIVHLHLADEILSDGLPDAARLQALGRLGGRQYADTSRPHELARPDERP
jgi:flavin reductase (DIM6/NTAB) family NADH-FMN oxidoreductase RutF